MKRFIYLGIGFALGLGIGLTCLSKADSSLAISAPLVQGQYEQGIAVAAAERFADNYDVQLLLISSQKTAERGHLSANGIVSAQRVVKLAHVELGIGPAVWHHTSTINGCRMGYHLSAAVVTSPRVVIRWDHFSNAGTCPPNTGQDLVGVEYRF